MQELSIAEINQIAGGGPAEQAGELSGNLTMAAGIAGIAAVATSFAPPVAIGLGALSAGLAGMAGVAQVWSVRGIQVRKVGTLKQH